MSKDCDAGPELRGRTAIHEVKILRTQINPSAMSAGYFPSRGSNPAWARLRMGVD
jgi:hypothetical protein